MLDNLPIKTRVIGILALLGVVTIFWLAYFRQTLGVFEELGVWKEKIESAQSAENQYAENQIHLAKLDGQITGLKQDRLELDDQVLYLEYIELLSQEHDLQLISMPRENIETQEGYRIANVRLTVAGNFRNLLEFIYTIEQKDRLGTVEYLAFRKELIRQNRRRNSILKAELRINRLLKTPRQNESIQTATN